MKSNRDALVIAAFGILLVAPAMTLWAGVMASAAPSPQSKKGAIASETATETVIVTPTTMPTNTPTHVCVVPPNSNVNIFDSQYWPMPYGIFIGGGDAHWSNRDPITHTVTSDTGLWDSGPLAQDQYFSFQFTEPGTYPYHCKIHPQMRGVVIALLPFPTPSGVTPTPCSDISFTDVHPSDYFYEPVRNLYCTRRAISGYSDNTFRPGNLLTRGQVAKIMVTAKGWPLVCWSSYWYGDVQPGSPFYWHIYTAIDRDIMGGYSDGTFRPDLQYLRAQAAKIVVLAMGWNHQDCPPAGHFSDVPTSNPFFCYIEAAYAHGVISGYADGTFRPSNFVTRGQFCKILYQALQQR